VAALFADPPRDLEWIQHSEWYLDPSSRPASGPALELALDRFTAALDSQRCRVEEQSLSGEQLVAGLFEFSSEADARQRVELEERISREKDESWIGQAISIESAGYQPLDVGGMRGFHVRKDVTSGALHAEVHSLVLARDVFVVELTWSYEPTTRTQLMAVALDLLEGLDEALPAR
jgi:hypothetical protein